MRKIDFHWRSPLSIKHYALTLSTFLVLSGLSMSCSDDDDDKNKSQQPAELADPLDTDEARVAWRWLNQLTNTETLTTDWASKTYEPTVGIPSENNAMTRIVVCTDLNDARQHFASLADMEVDKLGSEQTVSQSGVGKMTWTPSKAGAQNLAEVTVDTKLIPKLQKIVFCTSEQTGLNGLIWDNVKGTAYYRLGDVILEDKTGYYWVCVRPAFEKGDKGKSHWMHIFNASPSGNHNGQKVPYPEENIYSKYNHVNKYGGQTIMLPTKLKYDRTHIYNLSNFIWALINPGAYKTKVGDKNKGLCGFDYQYHGENFLKNVSNFWDKTYKGDNTTVWEKVFGVTHEKMNAMVNIWFFYQGYKWWTGNEATFWKYESTEYEIKVPGSESGDKISYDMVQDGFDVRYFAGDPNAEEKPFRRFNGNSGIWVVEYKTGEEISSTGAYTPIGPIPGTTEICRYNEYTKTPCGEALETEKTVKPESFEQNEAQVGYLLGQNGKYYKTRESAAANNTQAIAVVVYISPKKNDGKRDAVETKTQYHIIAMGLEDIGANDWADVKLQNMCFPGTCDSKYSEVYMLLDGLHNTQQLNDKCFQSHNHPVTQCLETYATKFRHDLHNVSEWFIPSVGQLKLVFESMDMKVDLDQETKYYTFKPTNGVGTAVDAVKRLLGSNANNLASGKNGGTTFYWTSTEVDNYLAWTLNVEEDGSMYFSSSDKGTTKGPVVRPFLLMGTEGEYKDE